MCFFKYLFYKLILAGHLQSRAGSQSPLRRGTGRAHYREHSARAWPRRSYARNDPRLSGYYGHFGSATRNLRVGRNVAEGKNSVSSIGQFLKNLKIITMLYRTECYDYLFDLAVEMRKCGLDPSAIPAEEKISTKKWWWMKAITYILWFKNICQTFI